MTIEMLVVYSNQPQADSVPRTHTFQSASS